MLVPSIFLLRFPIPVDVSDMEWVKVTGTAEFSTNEGQTRVLLRADSVDASDPPEEAMLY